MLYYSEEFLDKLDKNSVKNKYARVTLLTLDELPLETLEGRITAGSINIDGNSAIRRTCSLTLVAEKPNFVQYYETFNTKFKLEVGLYNNIDSSYPEIIWFPQGIYIMTGFNSSLSTSNYTINISGKDKMCKLNGECGGTFSSSVDFGQTDKYNYEYSQIELNFDTYEPNKYYIYDDSSSKYIPDDKIEWENNKTYYSRNEILIQEKVLIKDIIRNIVNVYGEEPLSNIVINDLDIKGLELLEYRGSESLYLFNPVGLGNKIHTIDLNDKAYVAKFDGEGYETPIQLGALVEKDFQTTAELIISGIISSEKPIYSRVISFPERNEETGELVWNNVEYETDDNNNIIQYRIIKLNYGDSLGYRDTDLVYAGDLIGNIGESVVTILDKIKTMLGNYEYFYNEDGCFIFQKRKDFVNNDYSLITTDGIGENFIKSSKDNSICVKSFNNLNLISAFTSNPTLNNLKNDFSVWGTRKGVEGSVDIPIHARYAIDVKPTYYKNFDGIVYATEDSAYTQNLISYDLLNYLSELLILQNRQNNAIQDYNIKKEEFEKSLTEIEVLNVDKLNNITQDILNIPDMNKDFNRFNQWKENFSLFLLEQINTYVNSIKTLENDYVKTSKNYMLTPNSLEALEMLGNNGDDNFSYSLSILVNHLIMYILYTTDIVYKQKVIREGDLEQYFLPVYNFFCDILLNSDSTNWQMDFFDFLNNQEYNNLINSLNEVNISKDFIVKISDLMEVPVELEDNDYTFRYFSSDGTDTARQLLWEFLQKYIINPEEQEIVLKDFFDYQFYYSIKLQRLRLKLTIELYKSIWAVQEDALTKDGLIYNFGRADWGESFNGWWDDSLRYHREQSDAFGNLVKPSEYKKGFLNQFLFYIFNFDTTYWGAGQWADGHGYATQDPPWAETGRIYINYPDLNWLNQQNDETNLGLICMDKPIADKNIWQTNDENQSLINFQITCLEYYNTIGRYNGYIFRILKEIEDFKEREKTSLINSENQLFLKVDWREIIYQMAKDYYNHNQELDFAAVIENNNPNIFPYYGKTKYENYYSDLLGFWRELYYHPLFEDDNFELPVGYTLNDFYDIKTNENKTVFTIEEVNAGWHYNIIENPAALNFWFEFIPSSGEFERYSAHTIGIRGKNSNNSNVKAICYKETPPIKCVGNNEWDNIDSFDENYIYIQMSGQLQDAYTISTQTTSAIDELENLIYYNTYCQENITITAIPIYYLQPNSRIKIYSDVTGLSGEYLVSKITLPLTYNGTMSLTASKAPPRLY